MARRKQATVETEAGRELKAAWFRKLAQNGYVGQPVFFVEATIPIEGIGEAEVEFEIRGPLSEREAIRRAEQELIKLCSFEVVAKSKLQAAKEAKVIEIMRIIGDDAK